VAGKTDGVVLDQLAFSADGRQVVGLGAAGLFVWDARTGQRLRHDRGFQTVSAIRELSVDGRRVLVESSKGLEKMLAQASTGAGILPGQRFPVSSTFQVLDTATGAELGQRTWRAELVDGQNQLWHWHYLPSGRARPRRSLSPDGRLLLAQTGKEVKLCELASGQVLWSGLWAFPSQGALGADGQTLVVVAPDGTLELADVLSGARRGRWKPPAHHRWALSADGRWLVTVHADTTALVWDVALLAPPPRRPAVLLTAVQREWLWEALAFDDPRTAWAAVERLARDPEGVALVAERLRRLTPPTREHIARLIEALGSQRFADRQAAARELTALGASARANLREALEARPPLELRRRIEAILADGLADRLVRAGEPLRRHRAVLVLERAGTKAARDALTALADGLPHYLTTEARAALARMTNRPRAK
jgi:hypothetical protein